MKFTPKEWNLNSSFGDSILDIMLQKRDWDFTPLEWNFKRVNLSKKSKNLPFLKKGRIFTFFSRHFFLKFQSFQEISLHEIWRIVLCVNEYYMNRDVNKSYWINKLNDFRIWLTLGLLSKHNKCNKS